MYQDCFYLRTVPKKTKNIRLNNIHGSLKTNTLLKIAEEHARVEDERKKKESLMQSPEDMQKVFDHVRNKCL